MLAHLSDVIVGRTFKRIQHPQVHQHIDIVIVRQPREQRFQIELPAENGFRHVDVALDVEQAGDLADDARQYAPEQCAGLGQVVHVPEPVEEAHGVVRRVGVQIQRLRVVDLALIAVPLREAPRFGVIIPRAEVIETGLAVVILPDIAIGVVDRGLRRRQLNGIQRVSGRATLGFAIPLPWGMV